MSFHNNPSVTRFSDRHVEQVAQIERETFSEPWSENSLRLLCTEEYPSFVLCEGDEVFGYVGSAKVLDELQIINVAVRDDCRGRGYGQMLLRSLDIFCLDNDILSISLEVRESNTAAISLYKKCGYVGVGIRKNFYRLPTENAVIMVKDIQNI